MQVWKRSLAVLLCALLLLGSGCAGKKSGEAGEQRLLDAYAKKIDALGYSMEIRETDEPNEKATEEKTTTCYIDKFFDGYNGLITLDITRTLAGVKSIELTMNPYGDSWDLDLFRSMAGALMQVSSFTVIKSEKRAVELANAVAEAMDRNETYKRSGVTYSYHVDTGFINFIVEYPKSNYEMNAETLAAEKGRTLKFFSLSKDEFLSSFGEALSSIGYSLEKTKLDGDLSDLKINPDLAATPQAYQLVHEFGYVGGYLLVYAQDQNVYQVAFTTGGVDDDFLTPERGNALLLSVCDPMLQGDPLQEDSEAQALYSQIEDEDRVEKDGLVFEIPWLSDCLTIEAYEQAPGE